MKKYFLTGLAILLPLTLTVAIAAFLVNVLTTPFVGIVKPILLYLNLFPNGFLFFSRLEVITYISQILILIFLFLMTALLGAIARVYIVHYLIRFGDYILHRIPLVNTVYKTSQDVIKTIFSSETRAFKEVVLVPFPSKEQRSIGLVTRNSIPGMEESNRMAIFVPTTPNPTSGFLLLFQKEEVTYLNMSVEEGFKYILSCGMIAPPFIPKPTAVPEVIKSVEENR